MPEDAMNGSQYSQVLRKLNDIQETLDGRGREPGLKQEVRELRHVVEGRPPAFDDGVKATLRQLGSDYTHLRGEFDKHVDDQDNDRILNQGKRSGLSELWKVILAVLGFLLTAVTLYVAVQQAVTNALGGS